MSSPQDFLKDGKWTCTSCGACCAYVRPLFKKYKHLKSWIMWDGRCIHLGQDRKCKIYETRPEICRIDKTLKPKCSDVEIAEMCSEMKAYQDLKGIGVVR